MSPFPFDGLNLALTTPFDAEGKIDFPSLETLIERYLAAGVRGFVLSSGTGMHVYLSQSESIELIARGSQIINGRATLIAQVSALLLDDVLLRARQAVDCGVDGLLVLPPFFEGPTDGADILDFYASVGKVNVPIIGYNVPQAVGVAITPDLFQQLLSLENFCAIKDSSGDLTAQASLIRTGLPVMNGADPLVPYALYAGARGLIWGGANFAPKSCVELWESARSGCWAEVREIWRRLEPAMSLIWHGDYVPSVYAAAQMLGYHAGAPRRPLSCLTPEKHALLHKALAPLLEFEKTSA
jgi:4-hydroxy-tetrahydrodipicolinate synthase